MTLKDIIRDLRMQVEKSEIHIMFRCLGFTPNDICEICSVVVDFTTKTPLQNNKALLLFYLQARILICYGKHHEK